MNPRKMLPIGIENFEDILTEGFYYVDKTPLIKDLLNNRGKVNLFTRPRRFGKSLNMSMLKTFFSYGCHKEVFDGLAISRETEIYKEYTGKFPVISITLKNIEATSYVDARSALCSVIGNEALRFPFLSDSSRLTREEKAQYRLLLQPGQKGEAAFVMSDEVLLGSLLTLCRLLHKHYGQKVILLIDEYDVPLDKAHRSGYYEEMTGLLRNLLGRVLKTNDSLFFSVLTGCLRIAKESIFTGLNNFKVYSLTDMRFCEYFGFTDEEIRAMLEYYGLGASYKTIREWYDGYRIGNVDVYCPWDVINYVDLLRADPDAPPKAFWINTSSNDIIRKFLHMAKQSTRREIGELVDGKPVEKRLNEELTYRDLYGTMENLWSVLFTTGYLTITGRPDGEVYPLAIPNLEIRKIFIEQIQTWFQEEIRKDTTALDAFCQAFARGDSQAVEARLNAYLLKTISVRDTAVRKKHKESFYHGMLLGLLSHREDWDIHSNAESGQGFSDILIELEQERVGIVIEVKYAENNTLEAACQEAVCQIEQKGYETRLVEDGMETILHYGIAFWKKRCQVALKQSIRS